VAPLDEPHVAPGGEEGEPVADRDAEADERDHEQGDSGDTEFELGLDVAVVQRRSEDAPHHHAEAPHRPDTPQQEAVGHQRLGEPEGKKYVLTWAWHPKSLPVATPHSQLLSAANLGMNVTLLRPEGWGLEPEVVQRARERTEALGGSLEETDDIDAARIAAIIRYGIFILSSRIIDRTPALTIAAALALCVPC